ncbi:hypothetical protein [Pseudooceanicola algae]|uniref:hypothetical protein n=1 Tax=Pseudooceanicola algae TaxID=1537215 RepID=UPI0018CB46CC|nr:hypothetical protein [Pseudooceanicola algae]
MSNKEDTRLRDTIETIERQVLDITDDLKALQGRLRAGESDAVKETAKMCGEIRYWIRFAMEMEAKLDEGRQRRGARPAGGEDLDLDAARTSIRCRLDRLRRCTGPETVSG